MKKEERTELKIRKQKLNMNEGEKRVAETQTFCYILYIIYCDSSL